MPLFCTTSEDHNDQKTVFDKLEIENGFERCLDALFFSELEYPEITKRKISGWQNIFTALDNHKYSIASNKLLYDDLAYFSKTYKKDYLDY